MRRIASLSIFLSCALPIALAVAWSVHNHHRAQLSSSELAQVRELLADYPRLSVQDCKKRSRSEASFVWCFNFDTAGHKLFVIDDAGNVHDVQKELREFLDRGAEGTWI